MNNITYYYFDYFNNTFIAIQLNESILILHTEPTLDNIQIILGVIKFYANYNEYYNYYNKYYNNYILWLYTL